MNVLVINAGSSSVKFQVLDPATEKTMIKGIVDGIGLPTCEYRYTHKGKEHSIKQKIKDHNAAVKAVLETISELVGLDRINAVGHRVVHGGEYFSSAAVVNSDTIRKISELCELAPLHNPHNLSGIKACRKLLPKLKQAAVFDTAFHQSMPPHSFLYAIPYEYYKRYKIRKYGFHGTSHKYVAGIAAKMLKKPLSRCNLVTCHLGNGSSVTAIQNGKSVDTSMGFTPLQGLIMGTRSGDIDPEVVSFLQDKLKKDRHEVINILNKRSGLKGICGYSDVRTIHEKALKGCKRCDLALDMFAFRFVEYIGAYVAELPSVDAIVFTAGIGEGAYYLRKKVCDMLKNIGVRINYKKNSKNRAVDYVDDITARGSKIKVFVIPTNEELMIAKETVDAIAKKRH
ncbi:acetate kinase [Candidatus Woesearchaeota archaeon]|nr:acetate kinase [Candidatus Woesearchaeota archaeon]